MIRLVLKTVIMTLGLTIQRVLKQPHEYQNFSVSWHMGVEWRVND